VKEMKKFLFNLISALILLSFSVLPLTGVLKAAEVQGPEVTPPSKLDPISAFKTIVDWVFYILLLFAGLMIILAGFNFITAAGDTEKVDAARNYVLYAVIGIVVGLLARGVVWFIAKQFGAGGVQNL